MSEWYLIKIVMPDGSVQTRASQCLWKVGDWIIDFLTGQLVMVLSVEPYPT